MVVANTEAVSASEFVELINSIGYFEPNPTIAVSVSGGADSTALLVLTKQWADKISGKIVALTINHNLRPEAKEEAKQVGHLCNMLSVEHQILNWQHDSKISSSIQENARIARYKLLTEYCKENNILHLLTAHHADDQIETMFFRLARGSGLEGLSAMSAQTIINGVRLIRPLLNIPKQRLIKTLKEHKKNWIEDPSNTNINYSRVHIRNKLQTISEKSTFENNAICFINKIGNFRRSLDSYLASQLTDNLELYRYGYALIKTPDISKHELGSAIQALNGEEHPPRGKKLDILLASIIEKKMTKKHSLAGLLFEAIADDKILIYREANAIQNAVIIKNNSDVLWDNRWLVHLQGEIIACKIRELGSDGIKQLKKNAPQLLKDQPLARIIRSIPSLWHLEELLCVPHIGYMSKQATLLNIKCSVQFRPAKALAGSCFFVDNMA